jgi:predicted RNA-binding Zn-ribbon protein involved in translation (DUF1610 family)
MAIDATVLGKSVMAYGTEVDVSYICPHCGESVTDTICFSSTIKNCVAEVCDHECPECGESSNLDVDLY